MSSDFYTTFILPYANIIVKICRAYTNTQEDFEDYYQEACLQVWRSHEKFQEKSAWSTWVYRVTLNVCMTMVKKRNNTGKLFSTDLLPEEFFDEDRTFDDDDLNLLYVAIRKLSEIDKGVILLYLEEKSYQEIAEITGTSVNNIGVRINRIKTRLKKMLDGKIN